MEVGASAHTGSLVSGGEIWLGRGAEIEGNVQAAGDIDSHRGVDVTGIESPNTPLGPLSSIRFTVKFPEATSGSVHQHGAPDTLAPGAYTRVKIHSRSTLSLSSGTYYIEVLEVDPHAILSLDTQQGPIIIHVRHHLDFKGRIEINGPAGSFLLSYLGRNGISIESPFNGTIIAPRAALRLEPRHSDPGFQGSFFAKWLEVEAHAKITYEPFGYWYELVDIHPLLDCVRRYKAPYGAALFGYENESDFPVTVPLGKANFVTEAPLPGSPPATTTASPPVILKAGLNPRVFWAPLFWESPEVSGSVSWTLGRETAVAIASNTLCQPGQVPPEEEPQPSGSWTPADGPSGVGPTAISRLVPAADTSLYYTLPGPITGGAYYQTIPPLPTGTSSSGDIGMIQQALTSEYDQRSAGQFTFEVTELHYDTSEGSFLGLRGDYDPYVRILIINGENKSGYYMTCNNVQIVTGLCENGKFWVPIGNLKDSVMVSRDQGKVPVHIDVWDRDNGFPFYDGGEYIESYDLEIDNVNVTGEQTCVQGNDKIGTICYRATGAGDLNVCFLWQAQFVDAGPWPGFPGSSEDFNVSKDFQGMPASFAWIDGTIERPVPNGLDYHFTGILDENGCIPRDELPFREHWHTGDSRVVTFKLMSQLCYDPDEPIKGKKCCANYDSNEHKCISSGPPYPGANVIVQPAGGTGSQSYCWVLSEGTASAPADCLTPEYRNFTWSDMPTAQFSFTSPLTEVTQAAAVVGHIFTRDQQSGLGIAAAISTRRYEGGNGLLTVKVEDPCPDTKWGSCNSTDGNTIYYPPKTDNEPAAATRFKYIVAHEFGHFVQGNGQGVTLLPAYYLGSGEANANPMCRCDQVDADQRTHCLQSLEQPNAAQLEGFAHFFAARVWNRGINEGESDCTFAYYKPFLNDTCLPGVVDCEPYGTTGLYLNRPPFPVDCAAPVQWRNNHCAGAGSSPDVFSYGTEYDWMGFYYAINNAQLPEERWSMVDIFDASIAACKLAYPGATSCAQRELSWAGWKGQASLIAGAAALKGNPDEAAARRFKLAGDDYGVSDKKTP